MHPVVRGGRRPTARAFTTAAVLTGILTLAAPPALAAPGDEIPFPGSAPAARESAPAEDSVVEAKASGADVLGEHDRDLLAEARAAGRRAVTVLIATARGEAADVAASVSRLDGDVGYRNDELGYVRAQIPTAAVEKAAALREVLGVDLNERLQLPDPETGRSRTSARATAVAAPGPDTPAANPYLPTREIGAAQFVRRNPEWDGRGITIGVLDSGVDLDHPSLQTTSTGERKIVDWVTATDPLLDGDRSWRPMLTQVSGPAFEFAELSWTAPDGEFFINQFSESITEASEFGGDVNRDGDTTDSWGVLYRPTDNAIWVDVDQDNDFTDEELRRPYRERFQVGHFGTDDPATDVRESVPFVVEFREDVDLNPVGIDQSIDFVNIGIVSDSHGSHVAGIATGNALFGGEMSGAAPGAKVVSSRACLFEGGCTVTATFEGMIDLVVNRDVDVVNMSIGGLPALNDGNSAEAILYNRLIGDYGVQIFLSAGNDGPGINTVGDPSAAADAVTVGATVSRESYLANYGARVSASRALFTFSSRGPSEDGRLKPDVTAPGSAVSTIPLWLPGNPVPEAGYDLPPGYALYNGTSMASPMAAGGAALLLSASRASDIPVTPEQLRSALHSSARFLRAIPAYDQGFGQVQVSKAWSLLRHAEQLATGEYEVSAPVCTALSQFLVPANRGAGIFNRCPAGAGGQVPGQSKTYDVTVTRRSGVAGASVHQVRLLGNDGTFSVPRTVRLPLDEPVTLRVTARTPGLDPRTRTLAADARAGGARAGAHGVVVQLDDRGTLGVDAAIPAVVVAAQTLAAPSYEWSTTGSVERTRAQRYYVTVPEGAAALQVNLSQIAAGSQVRFIAFHPYGLPLDDTGSPDCYTSSSDASGACNAVSRSYSRPTPGIWELSVEARRTTPTLANPFRLSASVQGVGVEPEVTELTGVRLGADVPLSWDITNRFGPVTVSGSGGPLGSAFTARPTIADQETATFTVDVPEGADRLDVAIGSPSDPGADLDLVVSRDGVVVDFSADGDSEESVSIPQPAPGTYTVEVIGFSVPEGTTSYDYRDVFYAGSLGSLAVDPTPVSLDNGETATLTGTLNASAAPTEGRSLLGEMTLTTETGSVVGSGIVLVRDVVAP